ncbi:hypothetical protein AGMMS50249_2360 [candidate division SR1 bacterium]|nr:hypothetical protein AGMMS50249_2360 [candidate division SR1 bacterium]
MKNQDSKLDEGFWTDDFDHLDPEELAIIVGTKLEATIEDFDPEDLMPSENFPFYF